jgi:pimeloyl-ACP methyl ester carboxylesterase
VRTVRRAVVLLVLLIAAFYGFALAYLRFNESSGAFIGAELDAGEQLTITGEVTVPWETVRVTTEDGVGILLMESESAEDPDAPWVIYFYGRAGRLADNKGFAMFHLFREVGLNVLSVDYRGYGASQKTNPSEEGVYADARATWSYLTNTRGVAPGNVVLYGYSLGGAVATELAAQNFPAGLITEGAFSSAPAWVHFHYPLQPEALARLVMQNRFENLEQARFLPVPWLILHGRQDEITPFSHAEALAETTAGPRFLVPLECGHEDAIQLQRDRMEGVLRDFLAGLFSSDPGPRH